MKKIKKKIGGPTLIATGVILLLALLAIITIRSGERIEPETPVFVVTYLSEEGECASQKRVVEQGTSSLAPTCQREGYTASGFTLATGKCENFNTTTGACPSVTENITVTVNWVALEWSCGDTVNYHGHPYSTVRIGTQCWFKENLRYTGTGCLNRTWKDEYQSAPWNACQVNGGTGWDKDEVLYQHAAAMEAGCPTGWKIPTDAEWHTLENYLATGVCSASRTSWGCDPAGTAMKTSTWGGNNSSGFTALPSGGRNTSGSLSDVGSGGYWWSSSVDGTSAWRRSLGSSHSTVYRYSDSQADGFSVRCLKI